MRTSRHMSGDRLIVSAVENLSMIGAKPVEILLIKLFFCSIDGADRSISACARGLRDPLRLIGSPRRVRSTPLSTTVLNLTRTLKHVNVHRFEETIGGRAYEIEVTPVGDRWRAQLRRTAGMPTAMMPFYGQTPDDAAHLLSQWL